MSEFTQESAFIVDGRTQDPNDYVPDRDGPQHTVEYAILWRDHHGIYQVGDLPYGTKVQVLESKWNECVKEHFYLVRSGKRGGWASEQFLSIKREIGADVAQTTAETP